MPITPEQLDVLSVIAVYPVGSSGERYMPRIQIVKAIRERAGVPLKEAMDMSDRIIAFLLAEELVVAEERNVPAQFKNVLALMLKATEKGLSVLAEQA